MKRIIGLILSLVIVISSIACILVSTASAESVWGTTAKYRYDINFDNDETKNAALTQSRMELLSAEGYDGKTSNMIHIKEGVYSDATFLNWGTTTKDTDDVFTVPVNPNSTYQISWRVKIKTETVMSETVTNKWFAFYVYNSGTAKNIADVTNAQRDTWLEYNVKFTTAANQTKLSFTFNAGGAAALNIATPEAWIDDIVIEESPYENPANWGQIKDQDTTVSSTQVSVSDSMFVHSGFASQTGADYVYDDTTSIKASPTWGNWIGIKLQNLKANTEYRVSFKHKVLAANKAGTATYYKFMGNGIYAKGATTVYNNTSWGVVTGKALGTISDSASYNFDTWNDYSVSFVTGADTNAYFLTRLYANVVYIDNFTVTEVSYLDSYYESPRNWGETAGTYTVGNDISNTSPFTVATDVSGASSNNSVFYDATWGKLMAIKLQDLQPNTAYRLSFKHKVLAGHRLNANYDYSKFIGSGLYTGGTGTAYTNSGLGVTITGKGLAKGSDATTYAFDAWHEFSLTFTTGTDTNVYFLAMVVADKIYLDDFKVVELSSYIATSYNNSVAIRTAEASSTGKQGMRIYNSINTEYADADVVEYGSIAIREEYLGKVQNALDTTEDLTLDLYDAFNAKYSGAPGFGKGVSYQSGTDPILWSTTDTDYIFTAFLTGIDPKYYADKYLIRSYAKDNKGNIVYGEKVSYSIYDVVYTILVDYKESEGSLGYEAAQKIIQDAIEAEKKDSSVLTYDEWLAQ